MTSAGDYQPEAAPAGSSTALLRALVREVEAEATEGLAKARHLLEQNTPENDRITLRLLAVWLISNPEAAARLRARLRGC